MDRLILLLKIDVISSFNEQIRDGLIPSRPAATWNGVPILCLKIDITTRRKQLFHDGLIPIVGQVVGRSALILILKIDVTASLENIYTICVDLSVLTFVVSSSRVGSQNFCPVVGRSVLISSMTKGSENSTDCVRPNSRCTIEN